MGKNRPKIPKKLARKVFLSTGKKCYHCGCQLNEYERSSFHIDHHPIPYRDIQGQCCLGVTDPLDPENLVPSCIPCNVSHQHEIKKWYFCGQSQFPCKRKQWKRVGVFALLITSNITSALITYWMTSC